MNYVLIGDSNHTGIQQHRMFKVNVQIHFRHLELNSLHL